MDFNAAYIKSLFKHCKSQHYVDTDGKLRPSPPGHPSNYISRTSAPPPSSPLRRQQQQPALQQPIVPIQQNLQPARTSALHTLPAQEVQANRYSVHPISQFSTQPSQTVFDVLQHRRAQAELAHAQATRARLAALAHLPSTELQLNADRVQQQFNATMEKVTASIGGSAPSAIAPTTVPASVAAINQYPGHAVVSTGAQISDAGASAPRVPIGGNNPPPSALVGQYGWHQHQAQQLHRLEQMQRVQQLQQILQSTIPPRSGRAPSSVTNAVTVPRTLRVEPEVTHQSASAISEIADVDVPINASEVSLVPQATTLIGMNGSESTEIRGAPSNNADRRGERLPIVDGVNNLEYISRSAQMPGAIKSSSGELIQASVPQAISSMAASSARPSAHRRTTSAPLLGGITKPGQAGQVQRLTTKTRCEATIQVRKVAERSQRLMFKGTHLYFADAAFQVPSTEEEAIDIMRKGTYDVDKETKEAASDLYYVSWSHTQFFSAQMAALGYRFVSSNLRRNLKQATPPPVNTWLRLEKYHTVPRPLLSTDTAIDDAARATSSQSLSLPLNQVTEQGTVPSAKRSDLVPPTSDASSAPVSLPVAPTAAAGSSVPQKPLASPLLTEQASASQAKAATVTKGTRTELSRSDVQAVGSGVTEPNGYSTNAAAPSAAVTASAKPKSKKKDVPVIDLTL